MKKIKNSDFIIQLPNEVAGKELSTGDYVTMRLYTVNSTIYTEYRYEGGICPEEQKVDAYRMSAMESGVVQMIVESHIVDISMPDGYFDLQLQQTTDYYWIKTQEESAQEQINELRQELAEEALVREAADDALEEEISGLTETVEELQSDLDSNYYLADEVDELLAEAVSGIGEDASAYTDARFNELDSKKLDASAYTPVDLSNYYNKQEVDSAISASVEDNKVLYVQFTEVSEGSTALTCSHTFEQIYEAYSNGRVVVGQFSNVDLRLIGCKENSYIFNAMYSNRTGYIVGSRNIYVSPQEEHIGVYYLDLQVQMDDVPTQDSQKTVKSSGVYDALQDKLDVSAYTPYDDSALVSDIAALQTGKLDASAYTPTDLSDYYTKEQIDNSELAITSAITSLNINKLDASAYTPTDLSNYYNKQEVDSAISGKVDTSVFENTEQATSALLNDLNDRKLDVSAYTPTDLSNYYTKSEVDDALEDVEVDLSDYYTKSEIDNSEQAIVSAITDIHEQMDDFAKVVNLTQAEYNAIVTPDPNTIYIISDANAVNMGNYYTKTEIDNMIGTINTALNNINGNS